MNKRRQFTLAGLFIYTTFVALLSAAGMFGDAIVWSLLLLYTSWCGAAINRVAKYSTRFDAASLGLTSALIVGSFVGLVAIVVTVVCLVGIWTDIDMPWDSAIFPKSAFLTLYPSTLVAWALILGDNYQGDADLIVYGLPFGLPIVMLMGFFVGTVLGLVADSLDESCQT